MDHAPKNHFLFLMFGPKRKDFHWPDTEFISLGAILGQLLKLSN